MAGYAVRFRFKLLFQWCFALAIAMFAGNALALSAGDVYERVHNSVGIVLVSTFEGQLVATGSAVTIAPQTMVTNRHVLMPGHRYQVYIGGTTHDAYMTTCDSTQDLCLLDVRSLEAPPVEFGDANKLAWGDPVYAIGAPNEIGNIVGVTAETKQQVYTAPQLTLSNGLITALRRVDDCNIIQTNAAISPGSSGGGLFDAQGRLVGITTFTMRSTQNINMALPVNWVARLGVTGAPHAATATAAAVPASTPDMSANQSAQNTPDDTQANPQTPSDAPAPVAVTAKPPAMEPRPVPADHTLYYSLAGLGILLLALVVWRRRSAGTDADPLPAPVDPMLQHFLAEAGQELDRDQPDSELWNAVVADSKGDMAAARRAYIRRRASRLLTAEKDRQWAEAARRSQVG